MEVVKSNFMETLPNLPKFVHFTFDINIVIGSIFPSYCLKIEKINSFKNHYTITTHNNN